MGSPREYESLPQGRFPIPGTISTVERFLLAQSINPRYPINNFDTFPNRVQMLGYRYVSLSERKLGRVLIKSLPLLPLVLWGLFLLDIAMPKLAEIVERGEQDVMATLDPNAGGESCQKF